MSQAGAGQSSAPAGSQTGEVRVEGPNAQLNAARMARGLQNAVHQRGGGMTLRLTPPEMGTVRIQMQITGTNVQAQLHTETESARTMLNQQIGQLRSVLEGQGLSVDRLSVQQMSSSNSASQSQTHAQQQGQDGQPHGDGRSRGFSQGRQQQQRQGGGDGRRQQGQPRDFQQWLNGDEASR